MGPVAARNGSSAGDDCGLGRAPGREAQGRDPCFVAESWRLAAAVRGGGRETAMLGMVHG